MAEDSTISGGSIEKREDVEDQYKGKARYWHMELALADKEEKDWRDQGMKVVLKYRDQRGGTKSNRGSHRFNILWSNTELLKPALYSKTPEPIVRRRFGRSRIAQQMLTSQQAQPGTQGVPQPGQPPSPAPGMGLAGQGLPEGLQQQSMAAAPPADPNQNKDAVARQVAEVLERGLAYSIDAPTYDFDSMIKACRDDYLLPGRGVARVVMESKFAERALQTKYDEAGEAYHEDTAGMRRDPDGKRGETSFFKELASQTVSCEYIYWEDYRQSPARSWRKVRWTAYKTEMTRKELTDDFGARGKDVPLALVPKGLAQTHTTTEAFKKAAVWEIWDKEKKRRCWVAEGWDDVLDMEDDPYQLEGFFPSPNPMYSVRSTDTMIPIPEYTLYQDQADEMDTITYRINKLIRGLKLVGFYPGGEKDKIKRIEKLGDNALVPVENFQQFVGKGGVKGMIDWVPIDRAVEVLQSLYIQRQQLKEVIYEVTGISDILRGQSDPKETATAARIKGEFGTLRLTDRQAEIQRFARDLLRLKSEMMAEHMTPASLEKITSIEVTPEMQAIMRDDKLRGYAVDIETDSTLNVDDERAKGQLLEMAEVVTSMMVRLVEAKNNAPELIPAVGELLLTTVRGFRRARGLEDELEMAIEQMKQVAVSGGSAQGQDGGEAQAKAQELQMKNQEAMAKLQTENQKLSIDKMLREMEMKLKAETEAAKQASAQTIQGMKDSMAQQALEVDRFKADTERMVARAEAEKDRMETRLKAAELIANNSEAKDD